MPRAGQPLCQLPWNFRQACGRLSGPSHSGHAARPDDRPNNGIPRRDPARNHHAGGATAAKYVRLLAARRVDVVLIEPNSAFVSNPMSNLVVGSSQRMADITTPYTGLARNHGVTMVKARSMLT